MAAFNDSSDGNNLLKTLMNFFTPERVGRISDVIGVSPEKTHAALKTVAPAVLAGIARFGSSGTGASKVMDFITRFDLGSIDPSRLFDQTLASDAAQSELHQASDSFLNIALGGSAGDMLERAATHLSAGSPLLKKLAGMIVPVIMGFIGNKVKAEGGSVSWLSDFLGKQEQIASDAIPAGVLGYAGSPKAGAAAATAVVTESVRKVKDTDNRLGALWVPIAAVAALIIGGIWLYNRDTREGDRYGAADSQATDSATLDSAAEVDGMASMISSADARLRAAIAAIQPGSEPQTIVFKEITFTTGTANLEPDAVQVVQNLADVLKEHPGIRLRVEGHTDDTGVPEANRELSQQRAAAVKDRIVAFGIAEERLEAVGKGADEPVATNDTEEGRALNRRVAVVVFGGEGVEGVAH